MADSPRPDQSHRAAPTAPLSREERLKAALKANMARRKAQTRARAAQADDDDNDNE